MAAPLPQARMTCAAPAPDVRRCRQAPPPDVLCFDPAYESVEVVLTCGACYDGIDIVVPAGQFISRVSQADADAQALAWGESQLSCLPADPASFIPSWGDLAGEVAIARVDIYGSLGFSTAAFASGDRRAWCYYDPAYAYCDGPGEEYATPASPLDRYSTRWGARLDEGVITYGLVGEEWATAPAELFPVPLVDSAAVLGFCFDANARPCFAVQLGETIELRRFVAGVSTTYSWAGSSPVLFFNGLVQFDDALRDVVAYYLRDGSLYARFQRESFGVEHLVSSDWSGTVAELSRIVVSDRGRGAAASYHLLTAESTDGSLVALRAGPYAPWPFEEHDKASAAVTPITGVYARVLVDLPSSSDAAAVSVGPVTGIYRPTIVQLPAASDSAAVAVATVSGTHKLVLVQAGSYSDTAATDVAPVTGLHKFTLIQAGSYSDAASLTVGPVTGVHAHV